MVHDCMVLGLPRKYQSRHLSGMNLPLAGLVITPAADPWGCCEEREKGVCVVGLGGTPDTYIYISDLQSWRGHILSLVSQT